MGKSLRKLQDQYQSYIPWLKEWNAFHLLLLEMTKETNFSLYNQFIKYLNNSHILLSLLIFTENVFERILELF